MGYENIMDYEQWFESASITELDAVLGTTTNDTDFGDMPF